MKIVIISIMATMFLLTVAGASFAGQGSKAEAKALVERAAAYVKSHGKEKALAEFNNIKGAFIDRDLYIFAYDFNGVNLALGSNPKMVGKNLLELKDANGTYLIKGLIATAQKGSGWYDYKWSNPLTKRIQDKSSYVLKIDDSMFIGCGVYK